MSEQRIVEVVAGIAASSREPLYAFTSEQVEALKTLGLKMIPVREDRIVEGVLEDLREAGFDVYRLDDRLRLRADGWTECGTCGGYGYALPGEESDLGWSGRCTDCVDGLVPPDGMVEAAARWAHTEMGRRSGVGLTWEVAYPEEQADYMRIARSMLVAAAKWEGPGE